MPMLDLPDILVQLEGVPDLFPDHVDAGGQEPRAPGSVRDLRFRVSFEKSGVSGELPYVVLNADVPSFRPQDEAIKTVVQMSGVPVFEELIDVDALADVSDAFKTELLDLAKA